jgi:hypothetical protein
MFQNFGRRRSGYLICPHSSYLAPSSSVKVGFGTRGSIILKAHHGSTADSWPAVAPMPMDKQESFGTEHEITKRPETSNRRSWPLLRNGLHFWPCAVGDLLVASGLCHFVELGHEIARGCFG